MTRNEMIADFIRELKEHDFKAVFKEPKKYWEADRALCISDKTGWEILHIEFEGNEPVSADMKGNIVFPEDLIEYSWLFMRTGIFLNDLDKFSMECR